MDAALDNNALIYSAQTGADAFYNFPATTTLEMNMNFEADGDLMDTDLQITTLDPDQVNTDIAFAMNSEKQDSIDQTTFNMLIQTTDARKNTLTFKINSKSTDSEKANSLETEMHLVDGEEDIGIKFSYDGTKNTSGAQNNYDGIADLQMSMIYASTPQYSATANLSFKTQLTEGEMPEYPLTFPKSVEVVDVLTLTTKEQEALSYEIQNALDKSINWFTQIPAIKALIGDDLLGDTV